MVFSAARILDQMPVPRDPGIILWIGIFPPPHLVRLVIPACDKVQIAVTINVRKSSSGFDMQRPVVDHIAPPALGVATVPDDARRSSAFGDDEIIQTVSIDVENGGG